MENHRQTAPFPPWAAPPQITFLAWCSFHASSCAQRRRWATEMDSVHRVNKHHGEDPWNTLHTWERHSLYPLEISFVVTPALSGSSLSHSHLSTNLSDSYLSMFSNLPMILSPYSFSSPRSFSQSKASLVILPPGTGEMALWLGAHCSPRGSEFSSGLTKV